MITLRKSQDRGHANHGWLNTWHSFSFADYHDPAEMGFGSLRVLNDDWIAPAAGFPMHPHRDMEILTWILEGALEHRDSLGSGSVIRPGDAQRMSAGTGIRHSEFNASADAPVHLLQIWILPEKAGLAPGYEEVHFAPEALRGRLCLIGSRDGREGSVTLHQDISVHAARLQAGEGVRYDLAPGRIAYLHLAHGAASLNGQAMQGGDGAKIRAEDLLELTATAEAECLLFDMAADSN